MAVVGDGVPEGGGRNAQIEVVGVGPVGPCCEVHLDCILSD